MKYEVVFTDSSRWHSGGIASIRVCESETAANELVTQFMRTREHAGLGAFSRPA